VTAQVKAETRRRILKASRERFSKVGFEAATTREIAAAASIGVGTLFNYLPSKEAIVMALVAEAVDAARCEFEKSPRGDSLEEDLFALIAAEVRSLKPHRGYIRPVLDLALSPLASGGAGPDGEAIRVGHLEVAGRLVAARVPEETLSPVAWNLYWTLYTGVLAFWAGDSSPHQEDTLAVLDHYLRAFVASLPPQRS
jgi:AcrR family transcriptional regulator